MMMMMIMSFFFVEVSKRHVTLEPRNPMTEHGLGETVMRAKFWWGNS